MARFESQTPDQAQEMKVHMLRRSIDRKRKTIRGHIKKATNQMRGALTYVREYGGAAILLDGKPVTIKLGGRQIVGLVMVKELFDDDYSECRAPVLDLGSGPIK